MLFNNTFLKPKKFFISLLALVLTLSGSLKDYDGVKNIQTSNTSSDSNELYISEIAVQTVSNGWGTDGMVKEHLQKNGYQVFNKDLNEGTDAGPAYIGYKTTTNKDDAIRKISLMDEKGGYQTFDYNSFCESRNPEINESTTDFIDAVDYVRSQYLNGSQAAKIAHDYLNVFFYPENIEDATGPKLGDYLISNNSYTNDSIRQFLLHGNTYAVTHAYQQIALGSIELNTSEKWYDRLSKVINSNLYDSTDKANETYLSNFYANNKTTIDLIENQINQFFDNYDEAIKECGSLENLLNNLGDYGKDKAKNEAMSELKGDKDISTNYLYTLEAYEYLSKLSYKDELGDERFIIDFFKKINDKAEDYDVVSCCACLYDSLNKGQLLTLKNLGLTNFCIYNAIADTRKSKVDEEFLEAGSLDTLEKDLPSYLQKIKSTYGDDIISVYVDTEVDLLELDVAMTTDAARNNAAANEFDALTSKNVLTENCKYAIMEMLYAASITGGVAVLCVGLGTVIYNCSVSSIIALGIGTMMGYASVTITSLVTAIVGVIATAVTVLIIAAVIICALVMLVSIFIDVYDKYHPEFTSIPDVMIDRIVIDGEAKYFRFDVVKSPAFGRNCDINATDGRKWNALYTSKDPLLGEPLKLNDIGEFFTIQRGNATCPDKATPISKFGNSNAVNINQDKYEDSNNGTYIFYYSDSQYSYDLKTSGKYIEDLIVVCEGSSKAAKDLITYRGYLLYDFNLSKHSSYGIYIGYRLTDNEDQAITDIRVSMNNESDTCYFGSTDHAYGRAGDLSTTSTGDDTGIHASVYITKSTVCGDYILSDYLGREGVYNSPFGTCSSYDEIPSDCEPINLFCGGKGYNFDSWEEEDEKHWGDAIYVYFKQCVSYADNNTEYVSGLCFVSGSDDYSEEYPLKTYMSQLGFETITTKDGEGFNVTEYLFVNEKEDDKTFIGISYTKNPKRAITYAGTFTAETNTYYLPCSLTSDNEGFMACETFTQGDFTYYGNTLWDGRWRTSRTSHAFVTRIESEGLCEGGYYPTFLMDDGIHYEVDLEVQPRALYVAGPSINRDPIKKSDFYISGDNIESKVDVSEIENSNITSVHELKNYYYDSYTESGKITTKFSIAAGASYVYDSNGKRVLEDGWYLQKNAELYMFFKTNNPYKRGKYIKSLYISSSDTEDYSYNEVILEMISRGIGDIEETNLLRKDDSYTNPESGALIFEQSYDDGHAFFGYSYTDKKSEAIGSIKQYFVENGVEPSKSIKMPLSYNGTETTYVKCGSSITDSDGNSWCLYTSTSGNKITNLNLTSYISHNLDTIRDCVDEKSGKANGNWYTALDQNGEIRDNQLYYLHYKIDEELDYISELHYIVSDDATKAIKYLAKYNPNDYQQYPLYNGVNLYIGITRTNSAILALKDIKLIDYMTIGESYDLYGRTYNLVSNDPINNLPGEEYLHSYWMYTTIGNKADKKYAITSFELSNSEYGNYETVMNLTGKRNRVNIGSGGRYTYYLAMKHANNNWWGYYGPSTASILIENPNTYILIASSSLLVGVAIILVINSKKKKEDILNG